VQDQHFAHLSALRAVRLLWLSSKTQGEVRDMRPRLFKTFKDPKAGGPYPVLVDLDFIALVQQPLLAPGPVTEGGITRPAPGRITPVIGAATIVMQNGASVMVEGTVETIYGMLRREDRNESSLMVVEQAS
jgi:hypothetical protein